MSFHCFKESEKSLNETPMWSTDYGGTGSAPCWDGGQRSKGHPCSMDRVEGSQTYQYMRGIDRRKGLRDGVAEACKPRWLLDRGQESMCVCVAVDEIDYMRCDCNLEGTYMPNTCKKRNHFVDSCPEVRVRCGEQKRQLCAKNTR